MKVNERINWAVEVLTIKPTDKVLEIGCGAGIAVEQMAQKLESGTITAIDQSPAMITLASKRNKEFIQAGRVLLLAGKFAEVTLPMDNYNKIFAFNVGLFLKNPVKELQIVKSHLAPDGAFYLFYQPPFDKTKQMANQASEILKKAHFEIIQTVFKELHPVMAVCIMAKSLK